LVPQSEGVSSNVATYVEIVVNTTKQEQI